MICVDTNIVIYATKYEILEELLIGQSLAHASVVEIEALGYHKLSDAEGRAIKLFLAESQEIPLSKAIAQRAIKMRQMLKMGLGDAIVAATAFEQGCVLWTVNERDFANIEGLRIYNPLAKMTI